MKLDINHPRLHWTCNKCSAKIEVAFAFRLCDNCLDKMIEENKGKHTNEMSDEDFKLCFLPPKYEQN